MNKKEKSKNSENPLKRKRRAILPENTRIIKQPNTLTYGKYDFSVWQIKGLVIVLDEMQDAFNTVIEKKVDPRQLNLFSDQEVFKEVAHEKQPGLSTKEVIQFKIPLKNFGVNNSHYNELRQALMAIGTIPVELSMKNDQEEYFVKFTSLFQAICPEPKKILREDGTTYVQRKNYVYIEMEKSVANALLSIDRGYTKFLKEIIMQQRSKYAMRIYMFISSFKKLGGKRIQFRKFQELLGISKDEYTSYSDFHKRVIRPAYEALHEKADCWFEMKEEYNGNSKTIPSHLSFKVITATVIDKEIDVKGYDMRKKSFEQMLITHFQMNNNQVNEILSYISPENLSNLNTIVLKLYDYVSTHKNEINSIAEYSYTALLNEFKKDL